MKFSRSISMLLLIALLAWSVGGVCAPVPSMHGMQCMLVGMEPVAATHDCCPPETTRAMSCHGKRNDVMTRCAAMADDEAVLTTTKYRDGVAPVAASASASEGITTSHDVSRGRWDEVPLLHARAVLDTKADLRI